MKKILLGSLLLAGSLFSAEHIIDQKGKTFIPNKVTAKVGDTLVFKNSDPFAHNAYTDEPANEFDTGMQKPGQDLKVPLKAAGKFNVECAIHPNMLLEVTVQ